MTYVLVFQNAKLFICKVITATSRNYSKKCDMANYGPESGSSDICVRSSKNLKISHELIRQEVRLSKNTVL